MIARFLGAGITLLIYFCAATLLAEVIVGTCLWNAWKLDGRKLSRMVAVARGTEPPAIAAPSAAGHDEEVAEQASLQEIIEARASKFRDLELRELQLSSAVDQLRLEQRRLADEQSKHKSMVAAFQSQLQSLKQGSEANGRAELSHILETLKPKQAKDQIMEMLAKGEVEEVVMLLLAIAERPRAKIIAELKTVEENQKLAEVLRRIRQGEPEAPLATSTLSKLGSTGSPASQE